MEFVAVDVETANADFASICQIGIASFRDGQLADAWVSLINPDDWFSPVNVSIHGIDENQVKEAPTWGHIYPEIAGRMQGKIVVCHTAFDRVALARACERYDSTSCECIWLDSAKVVRRAWPQFSKSGYGLSNARHFSTSTIRLMTLLKMLDVLGFCYYPRLHTPVSLWKSGWTG